MAEAKVFDAITGLAALFELLQQQGYRVIGPTLRDEAIVYDELTGVADLPAGWTDEQDGGHYRLRRRDDEALFGYAVGPHSFKQFLHVPRQPLWESRQEQDGMKIIPIHPEQTKTAFLGVRSCELHAIAIQDRVLVQDQYVDPYYAARRSHNLFIAVNCGQAGGTCFCVSMGTGPRAEQGFDLVMTELIDEDRHVFLVEAGSAQGEELLEQLPASSAGSKDMSWADSVVTETAGQMGRELDADKAPVILKRNLEHARWDEVAERCLSCGNCTQVCPTCFCTTTVDTSDLSGETAARERQWDSCFNVEFSYVHGGSVRQSTRSRYRQWLTHKLATWVDQFGTSGCVGCGRCITWCPVAIDLTEEVAAISESEEQA